MIIRVFRATVPLERQAAFEEKFRAISVPLMVSQAGLTRVTIGRPTRWNPEEFVMLSEWEDQASIEAFAGAAWNEPHIPSGMEVFITDCSVAHYERIDA
jgi:heme-degrading monooxygenase HmoA